MVEDEIARISFNNREVKLLLTIPGINVYSAAAIMSEIDDISRFNTKEKLSSHEGLVPKQKQSGSRDQSSHNKACSFHAQIHPSDRTTHGDQIFKEDEDEISEVCKEAWKE